MYLDLFFLSCRKIVNAYMLQVRLDDGTVKDINCEYVRMLPATFLLRREAGGGGGGMTNGYEKAKENTTTMSNSYGSSKNKPNILLGTQNIVIISSVVGFESGRAV